MRTRSADLARRSRPAAVTIRNRPPGKHPPCRLCALAQMMDWSRRVQQILPVMGATGCICRLVGCGGQIKLSLFYIVLTRSASCMRQVPHREGRDSPPATDSRDHRLALGRGSRSFSGRLRFGQGNGAAPAGPGLAGHNLEPCLGVVVSGRRRRWHGRCSRRPVLVSSGR